MQAKAEIGKLLFHDAIGRASGRLYSDHEELDEFMYDLGGTHRAPRLPRENFAGVTTSLNFILHITKFSNVIPPVSPALRGLSTRQVMSTWAT